MDVKTKPRKLAQGHKARDPGPQKFQHSVHFTILICFHSKYWGHIGNNISFLLLSLLKRILKEQALYILFPISRDFYYFLKNKRE